MHALLQDLDIPHELNAPLAPLTWYRLGGPADILAHPRSTEQLAALVRRCSEAGVPLYVLGDGANILVADEGVRGLVVKLDDPAFRQLHRHAHILTVGAGYDLPRLVRQTVHQGLAGLEALAGIPATLGGAVRMNAGGAFGQIGPLVRRLQIMDASGQLDWLDRDDLVFSYRQSNITAPLILQVQLELTPDDPQLLARRLKEIFAYKSATQPLAAHSAGCAFKNPPTGPSAGKLIDQAGLKGFSIGGAYVSEKHANFILTRPGARSADVLALMNHIQKVVFEKFGILLEREIILWP